MHMYAHCTSMCNPVNAEELKITFIGGSKAMALVSSCMVSLMVEIMKKLLTKFFLKKKILEVFF